MQNALERLKEDSLIITLGIRGDVITRDVTGAQPIGQLSPISRYSLNSRS
jgi:hypothetical protein